MFEVYRDRIKDLINDLYIPGETGISNHDLRVTTAGIVRDLKLVIPESFIDEPTVYEVLEELNFKPKYETKQEIVKREVEGKTDAEGNQLYETDIEDFEDMAYFWYLKKREND